MQIMMEVKFSSIQACYLNLYDKQSDEVMCQVVLCSVISLIKHNARKPLLIKQSRHTCALPTDNIYTV